MPLTTVPWVSGRDAAEGVEGAGGGMISPEMAVAGMSDFAFQPGHERARRACRAAAAAAGGGWCGNGSRRCRAERYRTG